MLHTNEFFFWFSENEPVLRPSLTPVEMENPDPEVKEEGISIFLLLSKL